MENELLFYHVLTFVVSLCIDLPNKPNQTFNFIRKVNKTQDQDNTGNARIHSSLLLPNFVRSWTVCETILVCFSH